MTATFITENIDCLLSAKLDWPRGWEITFRSGNSGLHHQLYVNGHLADVTDTTEQRRFFLPVDTSPREIAVVAVDSLHRKVDMSDQLPAAIRRPQWAYSASVVRSVAHNVGDRLSLHTDYATGQLDPQPLMVREIWPAWAPHWAWGEIAFGLGGFGFDGLRAPGLGKGAFGAASFGMDADTIPVYAALGEEGNHKIILRTITRDGRHIDMEAQDFAAAPPPSPLASIGVTGYDSVNHVLTLAIEEN